jgi:hypothetical protein
VHSPAFVAAPATVPAVAVILWLELLGIAAAVLVISGAIARWQHGRAASGPSVWRRRARRLTADDLARMVAEADALRRHAIGARSAAVSAEFAVTRARARSRETQQAREIAWHEYDAAQRAYANAMRNPVMSESLWPMANTSGAWPVLVAGGAEPALTSAAAGDPSGTALALAVGPARDVEPALAVEPARALAAEPSAGPGEPPEEPALPHDLSRAALTAFRRGDLSVEQLRAVFRRFSGWDARLEQHEREVLRRRAAEREAHRRYTIAAAAERAANREIDVAMVAARAWADEAAEAAEEARVARVFVEECLRHAAIRHRFWRRSGAG